MNYIYTSSDKSKKKAFKYCLYTGIFGGHLFYVGLYGRGVLYFVTCGGFLFGWLKDLYLISTGAFRDNVGMPLRK